MTLTPFEWSEAEADALRGLMKSDGWAPVQRILDYQMNLALSAYHDAPNSHVYYQGLLHGVNRVRVELERCSKKVEKVLDEAAPPGFGQAGARRNMPNDY